MTRNGRCSLNNNTAFPNITPALAVRAFASSCSMASAALLPLDQGPKVVVYHQTIHRDGRYVSILPLITQASGVTHVVVAAIHLNEGPGNITLNDDPPDASKYDTLWGEVAWLQASGVKVLGMLGGAAKGSYGRLDGQDLEQVRSTHPNISIRD